MQSEPENRKEDSGSVESRRSRNDTAASAAASVLVAKVGVGVGMVATVAVGTLRDESSDLLVLTTAEEEDGVAAMMGGALGGGGGKARKGLSEGETVEVGVAPADGEDAEDAIVANKDDDEDDAAAGDCDNEDGASGRFNSIRGGGVDGGGPKGTMRDGVDGGAPSGTARGGADVVDTDELVTLNATSRLSFVGDEGGGGGGRAGGPSLAVDGLGTVSGVPCIPRRIHVRRSGVETWRLDLYSSLEQNRRRAPCPGTYVVSATDVKR